MMHYDYVESSEACKALTPRVEVLLASKGRHEVALRGLWLYLAGMGCLADTPGSAIFWPLCI